MRLEIIVFGKLKTPGSSELFSHYSQKLQQWRHQVLLTIKELKPAPLGKGSSADIRIAQKKDCIEIEKTLNKETHIVLLDQTGKTAPTEKWTEWFTQHQIRGITIVIGSSVGFDPDWKLSYPNRISFGPHTMGHELTRIVLAEQLFRVYSVLNGHPYHRMLQSNKC